MQKQDYRCIPFWSWNDALDRETLKEQIHWMNENGVGGFFMHARSGLKTEYLSEEWMECVEACAEEANALGMKAWIYDENGWPSGFAGGKLLEDMANRDQYIIHNIGAFDAKATVSYLLTEDEMIRVKTGTVKGKYLNLYLHTSTSTADILNPEVVDKFIKLTHEAYKKHFGEKFSEKIEGFFTDEPQYYRWNTPYTVMIERYFKEQFDEDILDSLGLLFVERNGYRKFRYRYWKGMQKLMLNNYAKKVYNWCDENGLKLTGHYVEEITLGFQMMCCGGMMPFYEYEHIPGIDWLGKNSATIGELGPKQVSSVAAQLGKKQVLTETFGCCGWEVTPAQLKRIAGFQYVNGVNMMCQHLLPYSERGNRKHDYPAHYAPINPWVNEEFKAFNDYFTELGYLLGEGEQDVHVAMLNPIRSAYFDYKREKENEAFAIQQLDMNLYDACRMLSCNSIEYHFVDETLLAKYGFVDGTQFGCGKCKYDYLVLPYVITMDETTESLLRQYVENGGKVLILGEKPTYVEAEVYNYEYLNSNCTLDDMRSAQVYRGLIRDNEIRATYRKVGKEEFLYVINPSETDTHTQIFDCGVDIHSFSKLLLPSGERKLVPLEITLKPGEDAILFLSPEKAQKQEVLESYQLYFENAKIYWEKNYLLVDKVRYSVNGREYSKLLPVPALFEKLLKEQYRGEIFIKYEFEIKELPGEIFLKTEWSNRDICAWLNGNVLKETLSKGEMYQNYYDITSYVKEGINSYIVQTDWYEDDFVHYALFGENVTESLRNCIVYDSELQPIQLEGRFGVYPSCGYTDDDNDRFVRGNDFYIGEISERVTDITTYGFPFFAGEFTLERNAFFNHNCVLLHIPGEYLMAEVYVNGTSAGKLLYEKEIDISHVAVAGNNLIKVRFLVSNRNLMGPHHYAGDKNESVCPWSFEMYNTWSEDKSPVYHDDYDLKRFYKKCRGE